MTITKTATYKTTDGQAFETHKQAAAHQAYLDRLVRLEVAYHEHAGSFEELRFSLADIAADGDKILAALTKPVVPRKAKKEAA